MALAKGGSDYMNAEMKAAKHSAAGPYLGFALQPVRAFYHLLTCPNDASVSLEFQDDVAVHYSCGSILLEQMKSALKQNPISDWKQDLWNTFNNWLVMLRDGSVLKDKTQYRLYVTPPKTGVFVEALSAANDAKTVNAALSHVRAKLENRKSKPACIDKLQPLLDASGEEQIAIVANFALENSTEDPLEAIRKVLRPTVSESHMDMIIMSGVGQAKQAYDRLIQRDESPVLAADAFRKEFHAFIRQNNLPGLLASITEPPSATLINDIAATRPVFIRQLELVEVTHEDRLRAVSDYLRTSADKADWAERGLVFSGSFDTWDDELVRCHGMVRGDVTDLHSDKPPAVQGRLVYRQCSQHQVPLEGRVVPGHFVAGSFNDLADRRRVGWHIDFEALLEDGQQ